METNQDWKLVGERVRNSSWGRIRYRVCDRVGNIVWVRVWTESGLWSIAEFMAVSGIVSGVSDVETNQDWDRVRSKLNGR